jgi:hypothetical protein
MPARLLACPSCARHIRTHEERCPFCGVTCSEVFADAQVLMPPPRGLGRAELYEYARTAARVAGAVGSGMALAATLGGCNSNEVYGSPHPHVEPDAAAIATIYGAPPRPPPSDAGDGGK